MAKRKNQKRRSKKYQVNNRQLKAKRMYKDTIFRMLYHNKENLLSLYNAVNGREYTDPEKLQVVTLENAIYMGMKNDVSFLFDSEMNLYEHQSTFNPNMPLRDLMYAAKQLEKYMAEDTLYSSKLVKIPVPRFVVFYNGTEKQPERRVLKLSDAYEKKVASPELELKVLMLNINQGNNRKLMQRCKTLKEYCQFVECIRKYAATMEIAEAVDRAVTECIKKNILADFLTKQRAEVVAVSIFEYNEEEELKKIRAAEFSVGREAGYEEGEAVGKAAGEVVGKAESVLELLEDLGKIPKELRERILSESNLPVLKQWLKAAAKSESLQDFLDQAGILDLDERE